MTSIYLSALVVYVTERGSVCVLRRYFSQSDAVITFHEVLTSTCNTNFVLPTCMIHFQVLINIWINPSINQRKGIHFYVCAHYSCKTTSPPFCVQWGSTIFNIFVSYEEVQHFQLRVRSTASFELYGIHYFVKIAHAAELIVNIHELR